MEFFKEDSIEDVFCKVLTKNDDSGRHGVLIPVYAYHLFPDFINFNPEDKQNYEARIVTHWKESTGWEKKESKWKHYHRYPERRMTSLSPELLNNKKDGTILVFGKYRDKFEYECHIIPPSSEHYDQVIDLFGLNYLNNRVEGSALLPFEEIFHSTSNKKIFEELMSKIQKVNEKGYIQSQKKGDTAVGFTFEEELGIKSNSNKNPDFKGIEIKCGRSRQIKQKRRASTGKQTLFSLVPNWGILSSRRDLVEEYGKYDPIKERTGLYCTIKLTGNSYDWKLDIDDTEQKIYLCNEGKRVVHYNMSDLKDALEKKHGETVFVTAHAKNNREGIESFHYDSVVHCREVQFKEFINLIKENQVGIDFAIHKKNGKVRDHGFLWRLENKKYLLRLFRYVREVM
ncbi:MvaI/BcnI family restriction endonuclease [Halobacillus litoralis]|uniref:MvaI/BcnI family restriction endonuclease n=1 Tax=Halobacillus litoralis TaxID=45668 RepID=UPI001CFC74EE|nr:MvaI/BcnI family restriction endonuclease [Halobacillus litoralis]WLR46558.1 MvaI/BcnI family restriction endonuclease [Halobacillus litoralis]